MARLTRVILPGYPHHILQQGNRYQDVFFCDDNYIFYRGLLKEWCNQRGITVGEVFMRILINGKDPQGVVNIQKS